MQAIPESPFFDLLNIQVDEYLDPFLLEVGAVAEAEPQPESKSRSELTDDEYNPVEQKEPPAVPYSRSEERRIKNMLSARRSRARKQEQLDQFKKLESAVFKVSDQIEGLLKSNISEDLKKELRSLQVLCQKEDSIAVMTQMQNIFVKVIQESSVVQSNLTLYGYKLNELCK